jgi:hypothetical protein
MLRLATHTFGRVYIIIYSYLAFQIIFHSPINFSWIYLLKRLMYLLFCPLLIIIVIIIAIIIPTC